MTKIEDAVDRSWDTEELREEYHYNPEIEKQWWSGLLETLDDTEFTKLKVVFDQNDKNGNKTIEENELLSTKILRNRVLNEAAMRSLQRDRKHALVGKGIENTTMKYRPVLSISGANRDGYIELTPFVCELMMRIFNLDKSGHMSLFEYLAMLQYVQLALCVFEKYDLDGNGTLVSLEIKNAMTFYGYTIDVEDAKILNKHIGKKIGFFSPKVHRTEFVALTAIVGLIRSVFHETILPVDETQFNIDKFSVFLKMTLNFLDDYI